MTPETPRSPQEEIEDLRLRLEEAEQTLRAIRSGEVDSLLIEGPNGPRVYALEGASNSYRALVEAMNEGAATIAQAGTVLYCNRRFAAMLGRPLEQVMGSVVRELVPNEQLDLFDTLVRTAWEGTSKGQVHLRKHDGTALRVHLSLSALHEDEERVLCLVATDLTELSELKQALALREEFISVASHELRTPLTSLSLVIQNVERSMERSPRIPAPMRTKVAAISRQVTRLTKLVNNLLDISRIQAGRLDLSIEEVDLCAVVREVAARHADDAAHARCDLTVKADGRAVGAWDHSRVDQIVVNLLSNALKYGAGAPVTIAAGANGHTARLSVADRGIGIAPADQERIFQRFERTVTPNQFPGMGLGLWIAREIVTRLGGSIKVDSRLGQGACFTVELPISSTATVARKDT